jgi:hypothetical protein
MSLGSTVCCLYGMILGYPLTSECVRLSNPEIYAAALIPAKIRCNREVVHTKSREHGHLANSSSVPESSKSNNAVARNVMSGTSTSKHTYTYSCM